MSNLLRRSWSNRNGQDPTTWELPVNQASKWLVPKSGSYRILGEGGSVSLVNNDSRRFLLSVFVGDGGSVNIGGASGPNTIQIGRTGSTVTVTVQPNSGSATTKTATTEMPLNRWANVYLKATVSGALSNQITITYQVDFKTGVSLIATGDLFGNSLSTGGKTLTCNSLSGWAWFGSTTGGFWGIGGTSSVPIDDTKYREAVLSNGTWDLDNDTAQHTWSRPDGLRFMRGWSFQGGGGSGGNGGNGTDGSPGKAGTSGPTTSGACSTMNQNRGTDGTDGTAGTDGGDGGKGGNSGAAGQSGSAGSPGGRGGSGGSGYTSGQGDQIECTGGAGGSAGAAGSGGSGGSGGAGGRGVMLAFTLTQLTAVTKAGAKGARGQNGSAGGDGTDGGDGAHTSFGGLSTADANTLSTPSIKFGATEFFHGLGGSDQDGGTVLYYQW